MDALTALSDVQLLTLLLWGEARGESPEGMLAVAHVVLNRQARDAWFGTTLAEVILKPRQFSCFNEGGEMRQLIEKYPHGSWPGPAYASCEAIATLVLAGLTKDPTAGATHFHKADMTPYPYWAGDMTETTRIGEHVFYRE